MITILELENKLKKLWSLETCASSFRNRWSPINPSAGHCAVSALIVNDYFGGEIKKCYVFDDYHYFNIVDNHIVDLTKSQYKKNIINYANSLPKTREEILADQNTRNYYEQITEKIKKALS